LIVRRTLSSPAPPKASLRFAFLVLSLLVAAPRIAWAEPTPRAPKEILARDTAATRLWYFGWTGTYALVAGANVALTFAASDPGLRAVGRVGAIKAGLGLLATAVLVPPALGPLPCEPDTAESAVARAACEARIETRLAASADFERFGRSIWPHVATATVNVAGGLYLWLHDDRLGSALISAVTGIAVSELQIVTRPTIARDARPPPTLGIAPTQGGAIMSFAVAF